MHSQASPIPAAEPARPPIPFYVATDLGVISPDPFPAAADVTIDGRVYRRLDPLYYAWLRSRVTKARQARDAGKLAPSAYERLHRRFMGVHGAAMRLLGEAALRRGCAAFDPHSYRPPGWKPQPREPSRREPPPLPAYLYPTRGEFRFWKPAAPAAIAKVDAIRERALALGWKIERLYQNRGRFGFPLGEDYGLVCFVDDDERLGEVTPRYIEILGIPPRDHLLKFYNPDAQQPWHKKP